MGKEAGGFTDAMLAQGVGGDRFNDSCSCGERAYRNLPLTDAMLA